MTEDQYQLKRFQKLLRKYNGQYVRVGNLCIFGNRECAVNIDDKLLRYYYLQLYHVSAISR
jgi:hypothetical protein